MDLIAEAVVERYSREIDSAGEGGPSAADKSGGGRARLPAIFYLPLLREGLR